MSHKNDDKHKSITHNSATMPTVVTKQASWVLQRAANAWQVENDRRKVEAYAKNILFKKVVFVWEKSSLDQGGKLHQNYLKNCRALLVEGKLTNIGNNEGVMYMNLLWDGMMKDKCYVRWFTLKCSNTYQAMQDRFMSEIQWLIMYCCLHHWRFTHSLLCIHACQSCVKSATVMEWCSQHWRALPIAGGCQR
jgi:hypothetical protein